MLKLTTLDFYTEQTIESPDVWLVPEGGGARPRMRLDSRSEGDNYTFSMTRRHKGWQSFWAGDPVFPVRLVIAPHGAELVGLDELSYLRRSEELQMDGTGMLDGPQLSVGADAEVSGGANGAAVDGAVMSPPTAGLWSWHNIGTRHEATYHVGRQSFAGSLEVSGGNEAQGAWLLEYRSERRSPVLHSTMVNGLSLRRGKIDFAQALTRLMREPAVVASLESESATEAPSVFVVVVPPARQGGGKLSLALALEGSAAASSVKHRVCVMMSDSSGAVTGQARISSQGEMRTTFEPAGEGKMKCADGGQSGRWTEAAFGPEQTQLRFVYLGSSPEAEAAKGQEQFYPIPVQWNSTGSSCIAITIHLDANGWQARPPTFTALYSLVDGRCQ
jgi:hypothetical protein